VTRSGSRDVPPALAAWLAEQLRTPGPFTVSPISGGHSNETAALTTPSGRWILRRPPMAAISATANNLAREYRVLTALATQEVPAPRALAYAEAGAVDARACLVLDHCAGYALTDDWPAGWPPGADVGAVGRAAVSALARVHAVDVAAAGLTDFGRPERYLERQVERWRSQFGRHQVRELPLFDELASWLDAHRPASGSPALVHGDFHFDNCLVLPGPPVTVSAVIDWELATLGDPLVDLGLLLGFWGTDRAVPVAMPKVQALSRASEAPSRRELADHYSQLTERSTDALAFYIVLAFFKLAAIVEGAYARFVRGEDDSPWARSLGDDVPRLLADAAACAERA
jgi:aminoglycoside phosphotransferase (APT) family kinase protein